MSLSTGAVVVPALSSKQGDQLDRGLCPIRALGQYLELTNPLWGDCKKLDITFKKGFLQEINQATISSWLKNVIIMAYKECKPDMLDRLGIKAQQVLCSAGAEHCVFMGASRVGCR